MKLNKDAIFIVGNQKSGSSAIAALLSLYSNLSLTSDIHEFTVEEQDALHAGRLSFMNFLKRHELAFSKELIKEPALTFLYDELCKYFTMTRSVFVVRDPRDNIRSILDRIQKCGNEESIENFDHLPKAWQRIIDNRWLGSEYTHWVDSLSERWNLATDVYIHHRDQMALIRYEDFCVDKIHAIRTLAQHLRLTQRNDISEKVDIQYQPAGRNRDISWEKFFGEKNLKRIEKNCENHMAQFGYLRRDAPRHA